MESAIAVKEQIRARPTQQGREKRDASRGASRGKSPRDWFLFPLKIACFHTARTQKASKLNEHEKPPIRKLSKESVKHGISLYVNYNVLIWI